MIENLRQKQFWKQVKAYIIIARLHRPVGTILVLGPALWALWLASYGDVDYRIVIIFILGAFVMRSAGCVFNDIADRKIDGKVLRTKNRPLVLNQISVKNALKYSCFWCILGLIIVLQLNLYSLLISFVSLYLVIVYPYTKRLTYWPQFFLGMAFATAVPIAYVAVLNDVTMDTFILFVLVLMWAFIYDTEYAMVDREYDEMIDVRSTAILFGKYDLAIIAFFMVLFELGLLYLGYEYELTWHFFTAMGFVNLVFIYQLYLIQDRKPKQCLKAFYSNQYVSLIIFIGILFGS